MRFIMLSLAAILLTFFVSNVPAQDLVIVGGTLIDGTGREPVADAAIHIREGRIAAAGPRKSISIPKGAQVMNANGKYLIPGLMDANIHLVLDVRAETIAKYEGRYEDLIEEAAQIALRSGLTTVFDSWGPRQPLVNVRNRINAGQIPGSRIYLAGNIIGIDSPISGDFATGRADNLSTSFHKRVDDIWVEGTGADLMWEGPEKMREIIRGYLGKDIDFLKYLVSGHKDSRTLMFSPRVQKVLIEETHRAGKTIQTHTTTVESLQMALELGVDLLQHCTSTGDVPILPESLKLLVDTQTPCAILAYTDRRMEWHKTQHPDSSWTKGILMGDQNIRALLKAGANVLLSTDAGVFPDSIYEGMTFEHGFMLSRIDDPLQIGEGHFNWLVAMSQKGMKPMDVLRAATIKIAEAYKVDKDVGTLERGKRADLLVLSQNPLADASSYRAIETVIKDGVIVDRKALPLRPMLVPRDRDTVAER